MVRKEKKNNSRSHVSHDGTLVTVNRELWCAWNIKKCQQTCLLKMTVELSMLMHCHTKDICNCIKVISHSRARVQFLVTVQLQQQQKN